MKSIRAMFDQPPAEVLAVRQLEDAKRRLLQEQEAAEFHQRMVEFYSTKIRRLSIYVKESAK